MSNKISNNKILNLFQTSCMLFTQYGFHNVGVNTIVNEGSISKMTLYKYFPSKEKLINACVKYQKEKLTEQIIHIKDLTHDISEVDKLKKIFFTHTDLKGDYFLLFKGIYEIKNDFPEAYKFILIYRNWLINQIFELISTIKESATKHDALLLLYIMDGTLTQLLSTDNIDERDSMFRYFLMAAFELSN
nr:TetR/AcrR family transcriptional regulator [Acinetobacter oleivorans]